MRADRLLSIIMLLQIRGRLTTQQLAEELGVSRRTILRDVDALSFAGVPVYAEGGHGGGIALDENYRTTLTGLQDREVRALFVANHAQVLDEVGLGEAAKSTLLKLLAVLPASQQPSVEHIRQRLLIDSAWWWRDAQPPPFWDRLQQAVYEDRCIQAVYERPSGETIERVLEPYSLIAKSSLWYLLAQHQGELHTYRVARFHHITLLDTHFQRRQDFDLTTYWQTHLQEFKEAVAEYRFTLRLHPDRLSFIRRLVPGRYHVAETPDTEGWLTIRFDLESMDLARMLVFGLGRQAEIVEPPELKEAVLSVAREIIDRQQG
jgi:predicted DNA-binding transcriptional regulator YafY